MKVKSNQLGKPGRTTKIIAEGEKKAEWIVEEGLDEQQFLPQDQLQYGFVRSCSLAH